MNEPFSLTLEFTPNPHTLKYVVSFPLLEKGALNFLSQEDGQGFPVIEQLFEINDLLSVMVGTNFFTLTKKEDGNWDNLHEKASAILKHHLTENPSLFADSLSFSAHKPAHTEIEEKIQKILDEEIRPAVAMDGGDITFDRFEEGIVYVYLQGSCSGCPSSTATLKFGIETRLKESVPEVKEVVSLF